MKRAVSRGSSEGLVQQLEDPYSVYIFLVIIIKDLLNKQPVNLVGRHCNRIYLDNRFLILSVSKKDRLCSARY